MSNPIDTQISPAYRSAWRSPRLVVLILSTIAVLLFLAAVGLFPQNPPFVSIEAKTETLRYKVARPSVASIPLEYAKVKPLPASCPALSGNEKNVPMLIRPNQGTIVKYVMDSERVSIQLVSKGESAGKIDFHDAASCILGSKANFVFTKPNLDSPSATPLPIAGPAEMGLEMGAAVVPKPGKARRYATMIEGKLQIFGRTALPPNGGALYPIGDAEYPLPAGGRLSSGDSIGDDKVGLDDAWYGVARINTTHFDVSAATETNKLRLFRPGKSKDAETFAISILARLFNDPSVALYSLALVIFAFFAELIAIFWELPFRTMIMRQAMSRALTEQEIKEECEGEST